MENRHRTGIEPFATCVAQSGDQTARRSAPLLSGWVCLPGIGCPKTEDPTVCRQPHRIPPQKNQTSCGIKSAVMCRCMGGGPPLRTPTEDPTEKKRRPINPKHDTSGTGLGRPAPDRSPLAPPQLIGRSSSPRQVVYGNAMPWFRSDALALRLLSCYTSTCWGSPGSKRRGLAPKKETGGANHEVIQ